MTKDIEMILENDEKQTDEVSQIPKSPVINQTFDQSEMEGI